MRTHLSLLQIKAKPSAAYLKARTAVDVHECIWTGEDGTVGGYYYNPH